MADPAYLAEFLGAARIESEVSALRPDYRALLIAVDGVIPSPSGGDSEALLQQAESAARQAIQQQPVDQLPHIAAWRDAYRAFGAKPQRTRNSVEALTRRAAPACRESTGSPTFTTRSRCCTSCPSVERT
jgi:DNA/RNA-binding domain of Phe-tRNA-synthetase-like protein